MLVLLGLNHRSASVSLRERAGFQEPQLPDALRDLAGRDGIEEAVIVSTCNRVEIIVRCEDTREGLRTLKAFFREGRGIDRDEVESSTYHFKEGDVVRHLFRVASGLDSMVLGEPQILGQVKQAFAAARDAGTVGSVLDHLMRQAISSAKRVRTETGISRHAVSIAFAAVELARKIFGDLEGRSALLLGAGKMGALVATHLRSVGVDPIVVASRTYNRSSQLAERIGGHACNWDEAFHHLNRVDIVISGTGAPGFVLEPPVVHEACKQRRNRPLFLIDIAVPRDIDPKVNRLDNVYLYDVDDLQGVVDTNLDERKRAAAEALGLIEREVDAFQRWVETLKIAPTIVALRDTLGRVGEAELRRHRAKLGPLTGEQEEQVRRVVRGVLQKVLHRPIVHLKGASERGDAARVAALYRDIFGIDVGQSGDDEAKRSSSTDGEANEAGPIPVPGPSGVIRGGRS